MYIDILSTHKNRRHHTRTYTNSLHFVSLLKISTRLTLQGYDNIHLPCSLIYTFGTTEKKFLGTFWEYSITYSLLKKKGKQRKKENKKIHCSLLKYLIPTTYAHILEKPVKTPFHTVTCFPHLINHRGSFFLYGVVWTKVSNDLKCHIVCFCSEIRVILEKNVINTSLILNAYKEIPLFFFSLSFLKILNEREIERKRSKFLSFHWFFRSKISLKN